MHICFSLRLNVSFLSLNTQDSSNTDTKRKMCIWSCFSLSHIRSGSVANTYIFLARHQSHLNISVQRASMCVYVCCCFHFELPEWDWNVWISFVHLLIICKRSLEWFSIIFIGKDFFKLLWIKLKTAGWWNLQIDSNPSKYFIIKHATIDLKLITARFFWLTVNSKFTHEFLEVHSNIRTHRYTNFFSTRHTFSNVQRFTMKWCWFFFGLKNTHTHTNRR